MVKMSYSTERPSIESLLGLDELFDFQIFLTHISWELISPSCVLGTILYILYIFIALILFLHYLLRSDLRAKNNNSVCYKYLYFTNLWSHEIYKVVEFNGQLTKSRGYLTLLLYELLENRNNIIIVMSLTQEFWSMHSLGKIPLWVW